MNKTRLLGIAEVLASGITFGFLGLFGKLAYAKGLKPGEFLFCRFLLSSVILGAVLFIRNPKELRLSKRQILRCAALGIFGYALFSSMFFYALREISASLTVLLLYTYPVLVACSAYFLFQERLRILQWVSLPVMLLGLFLLVFGDLSLRSWSGVLFGFGSAVFYSVYILSSSRWLRGVSSLVAVFYIQFSAALILGLLHARAPLAGKIPGAALVILATAVVGSLIPMWLFLSGLKKLSSAEVSVLSTAEPLTGVLLASLLLGERMSGVQLAGFALVVAALFLVSVNPRKAAPASFLLHD